LNQRLRAFLLLSVTGLALGSCSPKVASIGYVSEGRIREMALIGKSSREDVQTRLGSPSAQSSFGEETWYYVTARKEAYAFLRPEVVQQDVVGVVFDGNGLVSRIDGYNINDSRDFKLVKRETPTEGHTLGFFEQVLGNVGRFNAPSQGGSTVAPGRRPGN
jgi:outer membrane protein assembly factor BamE (lipoprotein component of BamABCDE complex)